MSARRVSTSTSCYYVVSMSQKHASTKGAFYLGKIKGDPNLKLLQLNLNQIKKEYESGQSHKDHRLAEN